MDSEDIERIVFMQNLGLNASEISEITNKSRQNVNVVLRRIKQKR